MIIKSLSFLLFFFIAQSLFGQMVRMQNQQGQWIPVKVEIADTERQRQTGLMYRKKLPHNHGMLFIFENDQKRSFWMKNTYIPLSIAYITSKGIITDILDMRPLSLKPISSTKPVRYALEVNQGFFRKHGIEPGCRVRLIK